MEYGSHIDLLKTELQRHWHDPNQPDNIHFSLTGDGGSNLSMQTDLLLSKIADNQLVIRPYLFKYQIGSNLKTAETQYRQCFQRTR